MVVSMSPAKLESHTQFGAGLVVSAAQIAKEDEIFHNKPCTRWQRMSARRSCNASIQRAAHVVLHGLGWAEVSHSLLPRAQVLSGQHQPSIAETFAAGSLAAVVSTLVETPVEVLEIKLQRGAGQSASRCDCRKSTNGLLASRATRTRQHSQRACLHWYRR